MDSTTLKKLHFVHRNAPLLLQPKIHRVIEAISNSEPYGVSSPILDPIKSKTNALSLLQDSSDSFLALMRTLPAKHPLKEIFSEMKSLADKLGTKISESGEEFTKLLQNGDEALPGVQMSDLAEFAATLPEERAKLIEIQELCNILGTLSSTAHKEEKTSPVKHEMSSKEVGKKDKEDEDDGIGEKIEPPGGNSDEPTPDKAQTPSLPV